MLKYYFIFIIIFISLINTKLLSFFWININIEWNYEFFKTYIFIIINSIILIIYALLNFKKKMYIDKTVYFIFFILIINLISSSFFYTNIFWSNIKWHWLLFFINLLWFYILLKNTNKKIKKEVLNKVVNYSIIITIIWIKEYYFPSFDYWDLSNRAIWTFWHPNYLAFFCLFIIINIFNNKISYYRQFVLLLTISCLLLTKSIIAISLTFIFLIFKFKEKINKKIYLISIISLIIIWISIIYDFWYITKLNSFVSRFYIWETSLNIIISDIKYIFFWIWNDSLQYIFEWFKSPFLYIYENIWFTSDRPHNIFINTYISFWLIWLSYLLFLIYILFKLKKNKYKIIIISFLIFFFFNPLNTVSYLIIILIIWLLTKNKKSKFKYNYLLKIIILIISFISIILSFIYLNNQINNKEYKITNKIYYENIENEIYENYIYDLELYCKKIINNSRSVESYFYCWKLLENIDKSLSEKYYIQWLNIIPDMRNKDSVYYENTLVKYLFSENRFYSEKYSDIKYILKKIYDIDL